MAELFRKSAMDTMATPEQLDKQVKIIRPSIWLISIIFLIGMLTFIVWSFTYHITNGVNMQGVIFTNQNIVQLKSSRNCRITDVLVSKGEFVNIGDIIAVTSNEEALEKISEQRNMLELLGTETPEYMENAEKLQRAIDTYIASTVVKSNTSGYIQSVNTNGTALEVGETIVSIMQDTGYNEVVAYVPLQAAQKLSIGMEAQISPSYAPREEYGYMTGVVTSISEFPITEEDILEKMGTLSYVRNILPQISYVEVKIKLNLDSDSANTYQWSNEKGQMLSVELGTECSIIVITDEYRPIELLLE